MPKPRRKYFNMYLGHIQRLHKCLHIYLLNLYYFHIEYVHI